MTITKTQWMKAHQRDAYVKRAQREGYPSRSVYKLLAMQEKYHLLSKGMCVLDLGAAPGGWSKLARAYVGDKGWVVSVDLLPIDPNVVGQDVVCIQAQCDESDVLAQIQILLGPRKIDLLMSDMAPNLTGMKAVDQTRSLELVILAWKYANQLLKSGGNFVAKIFEGPEVKAFKQTLSHHFQSCVLYKPDASRARSSEIYVLGIGKLKPI